MEQYLSPISEWHVQHTRDHWLPFKTVSDLPRDPHLWEKEELWVVLQIDLIYGEHLDQMEGDWGRYLSYDGRIKQVNWLFVGVYTYWINGTIVPIGIVNKVRQLAYKSSLGWKEVHTMVQNYNP